ncbi:URC4/urg3 family protein [Variovorax dokdonensis]|uniref:URC4/urg3 family protein n=1 Tax=Variovorax dokdonensis TaxID=344883 RepID=A0ABT7NCG1_9BURK|nr:URC4/urg3 family protein [Variovorax dokdonensis]MDM0045646.1 URC4/urg3 family protein [Variovorax dokdonensis]
MSRDNYGLDPDHPTHNRAVQGADEQGHVDPALEFEADATLPESAVAMLRSTQAVRDRAHALLARARRGESRWFEVADDKMPEAVRVVTETMRERYPWDNIPYHSRWRHFEAGGVDRRAQLDRLLGPSVTPRERARAQIDLAVVSVLLDAGAGAAWHYVEPATGLRLARSEGLGVASFHAFTSGLFSSDPKHPLQADAAGLRGLVTDHLAGAMQVSEVNPMVGLTGRATLLRRLGEVLHEQPEYFGEDGRPGGMFDALVGPYGPATPPTAEVTAHDILSLLLQSFSAIWPAANTLLGGAGGMPAADPRLALGDCWRHSAVEGPGLTAGWMPFHKLSQWLTYSLLEPFEWAGVKVRGIDALTGLPEYRNGGLILDAGVLRPKDTGATSRAWKAGDEFIVEWRALTVALLDELAPLVRQHLNRSAAEMPLACVLEGGTWAAGRILAQRLRDGTPPLNIESDGTVF